MLAVQRTCWPAGCTHCTCNSSLSQYV